jgi:asparagine synthase (glutamine-hydrolysing)
VQYAASAGASAATLRETTDLCGIVGWFSERPHAQPPNLLETMCQTLAHRGPDGHGAWQDFDAGVALGHRRLAVVDLSAQGDQPMVSASGQLVIVFNGEIYNYRELRVTLEKDCRVQWRGQSDTEVLLEAISQWGVERALASIEGQFAFALWDRGARRMVLARDRFGEKPLYYGKIGRDLVFASELKAMRKHPDFSGAIDQQSLASYVRYGYVPHPASIYAGIKKLTQGCWVEFAADDVLAGVSQPRSYWTLRGAVGEALASPFTGSEAEATKQLDQLLRRSVASRMVADVPLGALLSGGIDSSLTVALMQAQSSRAVKTFTIGSWNRHLNEAGHAKEMARILGTDHTELYVGPEEALGVIPLLGSMYDEPFADSSQIPTYLVSQLARSSVTVALSGDGGDELFGGYNRHRLGGHWRQFMCLPQHMRRAAMAAVKAISPGMWNATIRGLGPLAPSELRHGLGGDKLHKWADKAGANNSQEFLGKLLSAWDSPEVLMLNGNSGEAITGGANLGQHAGFAQDAMYGDTDYYLPDDILVKVDRASMATSLEVRSPFLDTSILSFAWSLPMEMKISANTGKRALRRVLEGYVPSAMFERPKQGFAVPIADWLRGELRDWADDLLSVHRLRSDGLFNVSTVRRTWDEHQSGRRNWDVRLWTLLMMQVWLDHIASS